MQDINGRILELHVCGTACPELWRSCVERSQLQIVRGAYRSVDVTEVAEFALPPFKAAPSRARVDQVGGEVSDSHLDKLRRLCQLWDLELKPAAISSHRPVIGPLIVALKRALARVVGVIMREPLAHQRDFNAVTISLLAELARDANRRHEPHRLDERR